MALITYLTTIRFAAGAIAELGEDLTALGLERPLIVTDTGIIGAGLLDRLRAAAPELADTPVFYGTPSNPTERAARAALAMYRDAACDGLVALGGGSPIDLAKAVALGATHDGPLADYAAIEGGMDKITDAVAPVIAIPTTAGTGAEVGRAALITLADGRKLALISSHLIPRRAVCDPQLTLGLPPWLTAATGFDAITHCIETFLSPRFNPPADAIALDGLKRGWAHIDAAVAEGAPIEARSEMMMAALQGGLTFQKGLGAVHALSHPLGAYEHLKLHHGALNAVLLPHVLRFNAPWIGERLAPLARAIGLAHADGLADAVASKVTSLGLPTSLAAMGVPDTIVDDVAAAAVRDHSNATNPRPLKVPDYTVILRDAGTA
ncbi:MAG: iron-containing alcohol dehydrogenase [Hyphomonas sp.]|nr:iron-containing alcohol dehydrogenase [Hyphomonas sp.]